MAKNKDRMDKIVTVYVHPPIPIRNYDWEAFRFGYDEGDLIGYGGTEKEAVENLLKLEIGL